ncbi:plasmid pRiA4b ORF-3 family protein [Amycolatopsis sp. OK19-0408]|uniref:Plasmid pRiA4b ORF-3 family protein n=1 Tax=Amycolatopsis iheyensis TaxID=2945988 RepID=A0A9X2NE77_9PSEU|nr:plasmid pRiA4b ORF-3 family protein [Amycolatopsis iheyensis]MCR6487141.1 plasmid pRiA4b ORF-3 family protein [Amycolatopsis iheyensis]
MTALTLKVTLAGSKPKIWRRVAVPDDFSLADVHELIQDAFGWERSHLWVFETADGAYGLPDPELGHADARSKRIGELLHAPADTLSYLYDFGDDWLHEVTLEAREPGRGRPRCLDGRRAGPPEDCGGIGGYEELLDVLADPGHEDHEETLDWLGLEAADEFDPAAFDIAAVNLAIAGRFPSE